MPSPVGHALGGLIAAFAVNALARRPGLTLSLLAAAGAISVAPDLDLLVGSHRTYSHSVGGVVLVFVMCWLLLGARVSRLAAAAALTAAYASHIALDWMSKDTSAPSGLTALWPFTVKHYKSGWDLFGEISRRYWLPEEFVLGNIKAAAWELVLVGPWLLLAWAVWSKRTLTTNNEKGKTNKAPVSR
jgi:inner membrane protein